MKKKIMSLLLALGLLFSFSTAALAAETDNLADELNNVGSGDVVINLRYDATLDYGAREAYGTAETTSLTINGNGHTLTLNQTNSDWSSFGLKNPEAKLVLNNVTIEKTGYGDTSGAWNTHAINFTCNVEMNDVTVNNSMSVENGATLNRVTINEANGYYGLWIKGNGQSVIVTDGEINATNGGRSIKIADQYIDSPELVTLTVNGTKFDTAKKAAVLVSSEAGAKITVAGDVDITKVAADTENFVWNDEKWAAYYGLIEVTGGTLAQEGADSFVAAIKDGGYYKTLLTALNAAVNGDTITLLDDVEWATGNTPGYMLPDGVNIVIDGNNKYTLTATGAGVTELGSATGSLTLKNMTVVDKSVSYAENAWEFGYLELAGKLTCNNVTFEDPIMVNGDASFTNCTFTGKTTEAPQYGVWVDGGSVNFEGCTFTGTRGLKVHEAYGSEVDAVTVDYCIFDNLTDKPGIALGTLNVDTKISVTNSIFDNRKAGDQYKYAYETDTDVSTFDFYVPFDGDEANIIVGVNAFDVTFDSNGKITGGTFTFAPSSWVAPGYTVTEKNGEFVVGKKSSSSSDSDSSRSYAIVVEETENGSVSVAKSANAGDTTDMHVYADKGYKLAELTLTDAYGKTVKVMNFGDGLYRFEMSGSKLTIKATFEKIAGAAVDTPAVAANTKIVLTLGSKDIEINGKTVVNDVAPVAKNGRTMLPIRVIAEALGATVNWDAATKTSTIVMADTTIVIKLGEATAMVNGETVELDAPAFAESGRIYLPLRFVAENLGADVTWIAAAKQVEIVK